MRYGAVVCAVVAGIFIAVAGREQRPAVLVSAATATPQGGLAGHGARRFRGYTVTPRMTPWASKPGLG